MKRIMDREDIHRALNRIAHQIVEVHRGGRGLYIIGIRSRGDVLAARLAKCIEEIEGGRPTLGELDITLYRDDVTLSLHKPVVGKTVFPESVDDRVIILVDDVLYTGRTVRCALDEIVDYGRPRKIELAVLIDRGHRELPICPDYVGKRLETSPSEEVIVHLEEVDGEDVVFVKEEG